jgi:hypothetical protein
MKALLVLSLALFASSASAAVVTNKAYLTVDQKDAYLYGVDNLQIYCAGESFPVEFGSFDAAKAVKSLPSGLLSCEGDFVAYRSTGKLGEQYAEERLQIFRLGACAPVAKQELDAACKQ